MDQGVRSVKVESDESRTIKGLQSRSNALGDPDPSKHFRNVTRSVTQDALNVWADIWAELENDAACGIVAGPEDEGAPAQDVPTGSQKKGFEPSCGWPEFLEKMWVLRQNLDFLARFSRQPDDE
jgi:hypothetical protein